jgi:hypothetical protein
MYIPLYILIGGIIIMVKNNNLYNAIAEVMERGTFQQQSENLYKEEKIYKKLIAEYENQDSELMISKYEIRLNNIKNEMCYLNKRIIDALKIIEPFLNVELFCELFGLDHNCYDDSEGFYDNLLTSSSVTGHVCRQGLIRNEKILISEMEEK